MDEMVSFPMRKEFPMEDGGRTDKDDRFSVEQSTIAKKRIYNFSHSINVRTIITPEHRYAKIMKEKLNEDGSELSILNLGPTHYARDFPKRFIDGRGTYFRSRTNHWLHTPRF
jgi:hypothetical protein